MIPKSQVFRYEKITIPFLQNFCGKNPTYYIYCILVSALSVSADMKNVISVFYRHRPIRKLSVSGFIGISRYEKTYRSYTESFWGIFLNWWRNCQKFDGPSPHPIKLKNVMAIKAFCEKLMAITDGTSVMDHHSHVWLSL